MSRTSTDLTRWEVLDANQPNSTTTLVALNDLSFAVQANVRYFFRFVVAYTAAATTTGSRWVLQGPAAGMLHGRTEQTLAAATQSIAHFSAYNMPAAANATSLLSGNLAIVEGIVMPTAAGNLQLAFASEVAASAITAIAGSHAQLTALRAN